MRIQQLPTPQLGGPANGGSVSMAPALGKGPTGATGPTGPTGPTGAPGGSDGSFAGWINDTASATRAALNSSYVPKWQPLTPYVTGDIRMAPDGSVVKRLTDGTSGSTYTSTNWKTVATVAGTQAQSELAATFVSSVVLTGPGIDPTGVADSAAAIQAKIDTLTNGGTVTVPQGDFRIATTITLPSNVTLQGKGRKSRIFSTTSKLNLIVSLGTSNVVVRDIYLEGPGDGSQPTNVTPPTVASLANSGCGVTFMGVQRGLIDNVEVYNCGGLGQDADHNGIAGIYLTYGCQHVTVQRCKVTNSRNGINEDNYFSGDPLGNRILNNYVDGCRFGIALDYGSLGRGSLVHGNEVRNCVHSGIDVHSSGYAVVCHNLVESNGSNQTNSGIMVYGTSTTSLGRLKIKDNVVRASGQHGIRLTGYVREAEVVGNQVNTNFRHGIFLEDNCSDVLVQGNIVVDNSLTNEATQYDGIRINGCTRITVTGNLSKSSLGASAQNKQQYGVRVTGGSDYIRIADDNDLSGNVVGRLLIEGANSRVGPKERGRVRAAGQGFSGETFDRALAGGAFVATSGQMRAVLAGLFAGDKVTSLCVHVTASGAGLTLAKLGLFDKTGVLLASTADASATFNTGTGLKNIALTAPFTIPADDGYYIGYLFVGTTPPTLLRGTSGISGFTPSSLSSSPLMSSESSLSSLPATHTLGASGTAPWFGWA